MLKSVNTGLQEWIAMLIEAGVDVEEYGRREWDILKDTNPKSYISFTAGPRWRKDHELPFKANELYLYGFKYGPNVEDWDILCNEPTDRFAGEFWDLVEDRPLDIPGAWYD
ncbi:uncharacterized protein PG986_004878 [Apiospora aurea]|uniref:Uncharacterized protein n=1 Tax=Apiospora aurea TaxID=335848 RepID=A0ABR1QFZ4_9PEZI